MSHRRKVEDNRRLKKLYEETKHKGPGAWYDPKKKRCVRSDYTNAWLKTHTHRITRRKLNNETCSYEKGRYRKLFDYWWRML